MSSGRVSSSASATGTVASLQEPDASSSGDDYLTDDEVHEISLKIRGMFREMAASGVRDVDVRLSIPRIPGDRSGDDSRSLLPGEHENLRRQRALWIVSALCAVAGISLIIMLVVGHASGVVSTSQTVSAATVAGLAAAGLICGLAVSRSEATSDRKMSAQQVVVSTAKGTSAGGRSR